MSEFDRYEVFDEVFENEEFDIYQTGGNFPIDTDIVHFTGEEDAPEEILEAYHGEREEGWRVFEYNPRFRDRILNRKRIGEPEGYFVQFRTKVELEAWNKTDVNYHLGLMPKDKYDNLHQVLKDYDFDIEVLLEDSDVTVLD